MQVTNPARKRSMTPRMRLFAKLVIDGQSPKESYRQAYGCAQSGEATISANAYQLLKDQRIQALIASASQAENLASDPVALRSHIVRQLLSHADTMKAESSRIRALELLGKSVGLFTDKVEATIEQVEPEQLKAELEKHLKLLQTH